MGHTCFLCGSASQNNSWCNACDASLPRLPIAHCPVCALPTLNGAVCGHCLQNPPGFMRTVAVYSYSFPLDKLVLALKYGEKLYLSRQLGVNIARQVKVLPDCLIAMPLHPARLKERGFNQSMLLAHCIGRELKIPVFPFACQRVRNTPSQSSLPLKERGKNIRKAFTCTPDIVGKHVAIIDDVMTTGTTLNELALTLLNAGAREVSAWVIARTLPHSESSS